MKEEDVMRISHLPACIAAATLLVSCATGETPWPDSWTTDSPADTALEPGLDWAPDTAPDTGLPDTGVDTGTDPGADTAIDPGTDPGCAESPCGLLPNCGCPSGQKCYVNVTASPFVRECTTAGSGDSSTICTSESSCGPATQCLPLYTEATSGESMCYDYCNSESDCPTDKSACFSFYTSETYPQICSHACDPLTGSGCPTGTKCGLFGLTSPPINFTDCQADAGSTPAGGYCTAETDCGPGTFCATSLTTCLAICQYPSGPECSMLETCTQFVDSGGSPVSIVLDGISYGYCDPT
jgi:hypothetical protein